MRNIQEWEIVVGELPQTTLRFSEVFRRPYIGIAKVLFFFSFVTYQAFFREISELTFQRYGSTGTR
jgi:hypothetical protein